MGPQCPLKMSDQGPRVEIAKMQISPRGWKWKGRISDAGPGAGSDVNLNVPVRVY